MIPIPIPSASQIKSVYETLLKVIGFVRKVKEDYAEKVSTSSEVLLYRPGKDETVERLLNDRFPRIPGRYHVKIRDVEHLIDMEPVDSSMNVRWKFKYINEEAWWLLSEEDIESIEWVELVAVNYN